MVKSILFCLIYQISSNFHSFAAHATLYRQYYDKYYALAPRRRLRLVIMLKKESEGFLQERRPTPRRRAAARMSLNLCTSR